MPGSRDLWQIKRFISVYQPKYAERYTEVIDWYSAKHGIPRRVVTAIIYVECRFQWWETSPAGCVGPMQVSPRHWQHLCYT
ncbi:unnamed protein product, partial [marine sediment metagenome]